MYLYAYAHKNLETNCKIVSGRSVVLGTCFGQQFYSLAALSEEFEISPHISLLLSGPKFRLHPPVLMPKSVLLSLLFGFSVCSLQAEASRIDEVERPRRVSSSRVMKTAVTILYSNIDRTQPNILYRHSSTT